VEVAVVDLEAICVSVSIMLEYGLSLAIIHSLSAN
jgi:hypothetical protein